MKKKDKFEPTVAGCKQAQDYIKDVGLWTPRVERMDGYSIVFYANELYNQPKQVS